MQISSGSTQRASRALPVISESEMKPTQLIILIALFAFTACQPNKVSQLDSTETMQPEKATKDTISFRTSGSETIYLGTRILPEPNISDSAIIHFLNHSEISSIIEVDDSLFVFLNNDDLVNGVNKNLPPVNDSLLQYHYPKIYDVEIDDDLPYIAYLRSDKDYLELIKRKKSGEFYFEGAVIGDTVLTFMNKIKIGTAKEDFFEALNIKDIYSNTSNLTVILYHASRPSDIWYKPYMKELKNYEHQTTSILFRFKDNRVDRILIVPTLGFLEPGEHLLTLFNQN